MEFEVVLGSTVRKQRSSFQPDMPTPFTINVRARQEGRELQETAVFFQGVVTTGQQCNPVSAVLTDVFALFTSP